MASAASSSYFFLLVLAGIAALGLLSVLLLVFGFRGRRINDHPVCRKCRFDLTGVVPGGAFTPGTARCPECGTVLDQPSTVRVGERVKRPLAVVVGVLFLLLSLGSGGYFGFLVFGSSAMNPSKPVVVLTLEARYGGAVRGAAALKELDARVIAGTLSNAQIASLVERALEIQADPTIAWLPEWGDLVMTANSAGKLGKAQLLRYAQNAVAIDAECRKAVRVGEPIPFHLNIRGTRSHALAAPVIVIPRVEVGVGQQPLAFESISVRLGFSSGSLGTVTLKLPSPTSLGPNTLTTRLRVEVRQSLRSAAQPDPALMWDLKLTNDIEVIARDQPLVEIVRDDTLTEVFKKNFKFRDLRIEPSSKGRYLDNGVSVSMEYRALPARISLEVFLRWPTPGRSQPFGEERFAEVSLPAGSNGPRGLDGILGNLPKSKLDRVTVILRPSIAAAERDLSVTKTWLGPDLEFPDIPVLDQRGPDELAPK